MKAVVCLWLIAATALGQQKVSYELSFENAVHHEAVVVATFSGAPLQPLELRMARSSPGRYALHEFAKNVYRVSAVDGRGRPLKLVRPDPYQWTVAGHDGTVRVTYTLFGDHADGTYLGVDSTHAHFNAPAVYLWARGWDAVPVSVTFHPPAKCGWSVATQLVPTKDPFTFTAPGLQYLMDSPVELSAFSLRSWTVNSGGKEHTVRIAMHHDGTEAELDAYAEMAKRVVAEAKAVFGELPAYDVPTYTFIADYLPWVYGDGMEHRNSTLIVSSGSLHRGSERLLGTLIHEYFHSWNVERIRPRSLEPFDFERANMSGELWFAEGFTSYYGDLLMRRAGMVGLDRFADAIHSEVDVVVNSPGRELYSAVEMSMQAPFVDAATAVDESNRENTFISYYTWGEAIGLGLDLTLRTKFDGKSLDGFMRTMWERHGKTEVPYTLEDWRTALGDYTGDPAFAADFFSRYVAGHEVVDYDRLLRPFGFSVKVPGASKASLGRVPLRTIRGTLTITGSPVAWSPFYAAGLDRRDEILTFDGAAVERPAELDSLVALHKPGDNVWVVARQRGVRKAVRVTLIGDRELKVVPFEQEGVELTADVQARRSAWLDARAEEHYPPIRKWCPECGRSSAFEDEYCRFDGKRLEIVKPDQR